MQLFLGNLGWFNAFTKKEVGAGSRTVLSFSVHQKKCPSEQASSQAFPISLPLCDSWSRLVVCC